jgi:ribonuclease J
VIFAASVIPDNDSTVYALKARLRRLGVTVIENGPTHFTHVSGHPLRAELRELYAMLKPRIAVPVHGRPEHLKDHAELAAAANKVPRVFLCVF